MSFLFLDLDRDLLLLNSLRNLFLPCSWLLFATSPSPWELSSLDFFLWLNHKRTLVISSKSRVYFLHIRVVTIFSYVEETGREFSNINALFLSSNFTSIRFKSLMIWLNTLICWLRFEPSAIVRPYNFCLRYNLFVNDLYIYQLPISTRLPSVILHPWHGTSCHQPNKAWSLPQPSFTDPSNPYRLFILVDYRIKPSPYLAALIDP